MTEHLPLASRVQLAGVEKVLPVAAEKAPPVLLVLHATVPTGVVALPGLVSLTVAVQVVGVLMPTGLGVQLTVVLVARRVTVSVAVPLPLACAASPL